MIGTGVSSRICALVVFAMSLATVSPSAAQEEEAGSAPAPETYAGDAAKGEALFGGCGGCHDINQGTARKAGPALAGVFERKLGAVEGFNYSKAMARDGRKGKAWTEKNLDKYLEAPSEFLPKGKKAYVGIKDANERTDLIAYLKTL